MTLGFVFIATSLDGFIARVDGGIEWLLTRDDPSEDHGYDDFIKDIDGIIMGRGSFEKVVSFDQWPYSKPVIVLSRTLNSSSIPKGLIGRVRILNAEPTEVMRMLHDEGWKRAYVDGGQIIQAFLREGHIAQMVITRVPVLIGAGRSLFGGLTKDLALKHVETKAFPSGLVQSKYKVLT